MRKIALIMSFLITLVLLGCSVPDKGKACTSRGLYLEYMHRETLLNISVTSDKSEHGCIEYLVQIPMIVVENEVHFYQVINPYNNDIREDSYYTITPSRDKNNQYQVYSMENMFNSIFTSSKGESKLYVIITYTNRDSERIEDKIVIDYSDLDNLVGTLE